MSAPLDMARLGEVAQALIESGGGLRCVPQVEMDGGLLRLTVCVSAGQQESGGEALAVLELYHRLRQVVDVAQLRGLEVRYGIPADRLAGLLAVPPAGQAAAPPQEAAGGL